MTLWEVLRTSDLAEGVVVDEATQALLQALDVGAPPVAGPLPWSGSVTATSPVPVPELLGSALPATPLGWVLEPRPEGFELALTINAGSIAAAVAPGVTAATRTVQGTGARARAIYAPAAGPFQIGIEGTVVITGASGQSAKLSGEGVTFRPLPREVLLPGGFGLQLPESITLGGRAAVLGDMELALPLSVPILGGLPLPVTITPSASGLDAELTVEPAGPGEPQVRARLEWRVPGPLRLTAFVPTSIDVVLTLEPGSFSPGLAIPDAVRVRATASRPPDVPEDVRVAVTVESDAADGLAGLPPSADLPARAVGTAIVLAPAVATATGATGPVSSAALLSEAAAAGLSAALAKEGGFTLHAATLEATPAGGPVTLGLDVSGSLLVDDWDVSNLLEISMSPERPMRVRWRDVRATVDLSALEAAGASPASALSLDFGAARAEIVDAGGWTVRTQGDMFEIVGTRSGSGSTWFEIDLRFTLDLGPVRVTGATVRASWDDGDLRFGIRGLAASFAVPGLIEAGGSISLSEAVEVVLWAELVPLKASGFLVFRRREEGGVTRYEFALGVDLPVPIPLGPTGLSLYTVAAAFGTNAAMPPLNGNDPLRELRQWQPWNELVTRRDNVTLGAGVVVGTAVDNGFTFNALGVLGLTLPDFALRIGLDASFLSARPNAADLPRLKEHATGALEPGASLFGGLSVSSDAVDIGVVGSYVVPWLLEVHLPVAAHFGHGPSAWWLHAGSDEGSNSDGSRRAPPALRASVFPGLPPLRADGWAFVMVRGDGIHDLAGSGVNLSGASVAVGVGFAKVFGARGVLWAEVGATVIAAVGTHPFMFWAKGELVGSVGLGPFRLGVDAEVTVRVGPGEDVRLHFIVCAEVDLWLTTLRGCIEIGTLASDVAEPPVPDDSDWPFPLVNLADGLGRLRIDPADPHAEEPRPGSGGAPTGGWQDAPVVWPDVLPLLSFPIAPVTTVGLMGGAQNAGLTGSGEYRFEWHLTAVLLEKLNSQGAVVGSVPLSNATWQAAPEDTVTTSGLRQLALLTTSRGVSMVHRSDGIDAEGGPLAPVAGLCARTFPVARAWSLGVEAQPAGIGHWHVSGRYGPFTPLSLVVFSAPVGFTASSSLPPNTIAPPALLYSAGPYRFEVPEPVADTTMAGALRLESAAGSPFHDDFPRETERGVFARALLHTIVFDEPVVDGDLYLLVRSANEHETRELLQEADDVTVFASGGTRTVPFEELDELPEGVVGRVAIARDGEDPADGVEWSAPADMGVSVLGLHATSLATLTSAGTAQGNTQVVVDDDEEKFEDPAATRTMLEAGERYRITVRMDWARWKDGAAAPDVVPGTEQERSWYFRTASKDPVALGGAATTVALAPWKGVGLLPAVTSLLIGHSRFDPAYLERYLDGYGIPDHASFVFWGDRELVSARFSAVHIVQLAAAFGRDVQLLLRRTDRQEPSKSEFPLIIAALMKPRASLGLLVAQAATLLGCRVPAQAVDLRWPGALEKDARYELSVALPLKDDEPVAGDPELAGITFSTSSYKNPQELVERFGLVAAAAGDELLAAHASGDLRVNAVTLAAGATVDDSAFEAAVTALGLPPLRPVSEPRSSVLWTRTADGRWGVQGVLLESTEPMIRDDGRRMSLGDAQLGDDSFPVRRANHAGTRALWLASAPVVPEQPLTFGLTATDRGVPFTRRLMVPPEPRFANTALAAVA